MLPSSSSPCVSTSLRQWPLWLVAVLIFGVLCIVACNESAAVWARGLWSWMLDPIFHDWHVVRLGLESHVAGIDPLSDPKHPYNYPRLLLLGSTIGLQHLPPIFVGLAMAAVTLIAICSVLGRDGRMPAIAGAVLLLSPPVWLLLERGNIDGWVLVAVVAGLIALTRSAAPIWHAIGAMLLLAAALVKLYPAIVIAAGLLEWSGARRRWLLAALAVFFMLLILHRDEPGLILHKTGRGVEASYGWAVVPSRIIIDTATPREAVPAILRSAHVFSLIWLAVAALVGWRMRTRLPVLPVDGLARACFWAGALVYSGSFALGSNWSYRLVFLLLCTPVLVTVAGIPRWRIPGTAALLLVFVVLFAPFRLPAGPFYFVQITGWLMAGMLTTGAVAILGGAQTLPRSESGPDRCPHWTKTVGSGNLDSCKALGTKHGRGGFGGVAPGWPH